MKDRFKVQGSRFKVKTKIQEPRAKSKELVARNQGPKVKCRGTRDPGPATWIFQLTRARLSAMVSLSALAGWALHPDPAGGPWLLFLGVFLLAGGSTALNQMQERDLDARMLRTRDRPLPSGRIRPHIALVLAGACIGGGLSALAAGGQVPALLGVSAVLFYNGIYTPLKRRTAFAVLPGAVCGALPPLIGWTVAGGHPSDFRALLLAGLLFLWQVPHFWLFAEKHREDYRRAGLPRLETSLAPAQVRRLAFAWSLALAAAIAALAAFALLLLPYSRSLTFLCSLLLFALALDIRQRFAAAPACLFLRLTGGMAVILAGILLNRWIAF